MRIPVLIITLFGLSVFTSCQEELIYNPFESSGNGMSRYLARVEETIYSNSGLSQNETVAVLFCNPSYDKNGRLNVAYNNFVGYDSNYSYYYFNDEIETVANCKSGEVIRRKYTIQNNNIISCSESSNLDNYIRFYQYSYDATTNALNKIVVYDEEYDFRSEIYIEWEVGNISSVEVKLESGYTSRYDFKFTEKHHCEPNIPFFFTSCYEIGGIYGVDELLSMQNYFGKSISKDLPDEIYFNDKISRVFEYEIDSDGSIYKINQVDVDHRKIYRTYTFKWI